MKLRSLFLALAIVAGVVPSSAFVRGGAAITSPINFVTTLKIGGGGFVSGISISTDGTTKVIRTDSYGPYVSVNGGPWSPLLTSISMPIADLAVDSYGGTYEIAVAPSDPTRIYMYQNGFVYKSTDTGAHFTKTNYSQITADPNNSNRLCGRFMAVDPQNANVVFVGSPSKLWVTSDGGTTFAQVTGVATASPFNGGTGGILVAFDPTSSVVGGKKQGIYTSSYGNGLYHSTDGGANWTLLNSSGMPTTFTKLIVDQNGVVYVIDNSSGGPSGLLKRYNGSWSSFAGATSGAPYHAVAVNPNNASNIYLSKDNGSLLGSTDAGATWPIDTNSFTSASAGQPLWLANTFEEGNLSVADIVFDPSLANMLYFAEGIGVWNINPPTTAVSTITWTNQTAATEQLVTTSMMSSPGNSPIATFEDRPYFRITDPSTYPASQLRPTIATSTSSVTIPTVTNPGSPVSKSFTTASTVTIPNSSWLYIQETSNPANTMRGQLTSGSGSTSISVSVYRASGTGTFSDWTLLIDAPPSNNPIVYGWATDYAAPSPSTIVFLSNKFGADFSGFSSDGGVSLQLMPSLPSPANLGGCIAAASASNWIIVQSDNGFLFNTTNAGVTWTQRNPAAWPTSGETGLGFVSNNRGKGCAADRVTANKFYVWNYGPTAVPSIKGIWASTDGGVTWAQVSGTLDLTSGGPISNFQLKSVPMVSGGTNTAGHLFFTPGQNTGTTTFPTGVLFKRSTDGGVNWSNVPDVQDVFSFGFGAPIGGGTYPAIFVFGWVGKAATFTNGQANIAVSNNYSANDLVTFSTTGSLPTNFAAATQYYVLSSGLSSTNIQVSATPGGTAITAGSAGSGTQKAIAGGIWRSTDNATSWQQLTNIYPNNSLDTPTTVEGEMNTYGRFYMGGGGSGFSYGDHFNFLLKRDLDPAANDNDPVWLEKAA